MAKCVLQKHPFAVILGVLIFALYCRSVVAQGLCIPNDLNQIFKKIITNIYLNSFLEAGQHCKLLGVEVPATICATSCDLFPGVPAFCSTGLKCCLQPAKEAPAQNTDR